MEAVVGKATAMIFPDEYKKSYSRGFLCTINIIYTCISTGPKLSSRRVKASSNIASMSVTIQSLDNTAVGDQMVAASAQPQSWVHHEEERQSQEHFLLASRDEDQ